MIVVDNFNEYNEFNDLHVRHYDHSRLFKSNASHGVRSFWQFSLNLFLVNFVLKLIIRDELHQKVLWRRRGLPTI